MYFSASCLGGQVPPQGRRGDHEQGNTELLPGHRAPHTRNVQNDLCIFLILQSLHNKEQ